MDSPVSAAVKKIFSRRVFQPGAGADESCRAEGVDTPPFIPLKNPDMSRERLTGRHGLVYMRRGRRGLLTELAKFDPAQAVVIPNEIYRDGFIVIRNRGDSMEKLIMDGASVVIDISSREIVSGSIYALSVPGEGCIIRECHSEPGGLLLRPYNRNYPVSLLDWDEFDPDMVVGRVFCSVMNVFR